MHKILCGNFSEGREKKLHLNDVSGNVLKRRWMCGAGGVNTKKW
jgi:hypothetical protein